MCGFIRSYKKIIMVTYMELDMELYMDPYMDYLWDEMQS